MLRGSGAAPSPQPPPLPPAALGRLRGNPLGNRLLCDESRNETRFPPKKGDACFFRSPSPSSSSAGDARDPGIPTSLFASRRRGCHGARGSRARGRSPLRLAPLDQDFLEADQHTGRVGKSSNEKLSEI